MHALAMFDSAARIVAAILLNSLWEDALLAAAVWLLLRALPNLSATTRYAVWCTALVAAVVLPPLTTLPFVVTQHGAVASSALPMNTGGAGSAARNKSAASKATAIRERSNPTPAATQAARRARFSFPLIGGVVAFAVWIAIALGILARLIVALSQLERIKRDALPLPMEYRDHMERWNDASKGARDVRICTSDGTSVPVAVGLFDAMIVIPQHLLESLSSEEIDQVALHELAHLRRGDDWTNGLQRVAQALLFFNPGVAFIARNLDIEREVACDDWVLAATGAIRPYAHCLTKMAEMTVWPHRAVAAPGVFVTRKGISLRIERLLRAGRNIRTGVSLGAAACATAVIVGLFFVLEAIAPSIAFVAPVDAHVALTKPAPSPKPPVKRVAENTVHVHLPARTLHVPAVDVPAQTVHIPAIHVPERMIHVPAVSVDASLDRYRRARDRALAQSLRGIGPTIERSVAASVRGIDAGVTQSRHTLLSRSGSCAACTLNGDDFSGRDLSRIDLAGAKLMGVDFTGANLSHANLSHATFTGVDFTRANLTDANVDGASFIGCSFSDTLLAGVDFSKATTIGSDFSTARRR